MWPNDHRNHPVPEFIDPVFTKTSPKRSFSLNRKRAFWLVFANTGSIISGTEHVSSLHYRLRHRGNGMPVSSLHYRLRHHGNGMPLFKRPPPPTHQLTVRRCSDLQMYQANMTTLFVMLFKRYTLLDNKFIAIILGSGSYPKLGQLQFGSWQIKSAHNMTTT